MVLGPSRAEFGGGRFPVEWLGVRFGTLHVVPLHASQHRVLESL